MEQLKIISQVSNSAYREIYDGRPPVAVFNEMITAINTLITQGTNGGNGSDVKLAAIALQGNQLQAQMSDGQILRQDLSSLQTSSDPQQLILNQFDLGIEQGNQVSLLPLVSQVYELDDLGQLSTVSNPSRGSIAFIEDANGLGQKGIVAFDGIRWTSPLIMDTSNTMPTTPDQVYPAGVGVMVRADGGGIQASRSPGSVTITVPNEVMLKSFRVIGSASDLASGEVRIQLSGGRGSGTIYNTDNSDGIHPVLIIQNRTSILPSDPMLQRPDDANDSINIFDEKITSPGQVVSKVTGLSGDWGIKGIL
ncbi:MAG: hypothetical protein AAF242_09810 [Bacteroidota bacterium]